MYLLVLPIGSANKSTNYTFVFLGNSLFKNYQYRFTDVAHDDHPYDEYCPRVWA